MAEKQRSFHTAVEHSGVSTPQYTASLYTAVPQRSFYTAVSQRSLYTAAATRRGTSPTQRSFYTAAAIRRNVMTAEFLCCENDEVSEETERRTSLESREGKLRSTVPVLRGQARPSRVDET